MRALILAGGAGTRLRPLTYRIPKPIIPVVNKPLLVHQIELLKKYGITEIILSLYYLPDEIKKVLGDGKKLGVRLFYSIEETPLGTAGAVKNAAAYFDDEPLIILNGDIITELNLEKVIEFYRQKKASLVIVLTPVADPSHYGLVVTDASSRIIKFLEKPTGAEIVTDRINAGTYVMDSRLFDYWQNGREFSFEKELFPDLLARGVPCFGYVHQNYWMDLGSPAKYLQTHFDVMLGKINLTPAGTALEAGFWAGAGSQFEEENFPDGKLAVIGRNCRILKGARIKKLTTLGDAVEIGGYSTVEKSLVMSGTKIGKNVIIQEAIIGEDVVIEDGAVIKSGTVLAHGSRIKKGGL